MPGRSDRKGKGSGRPRRASPRGAASSPTWSSPTPSRRPWGRFGAWAASSAFGVSGSIALSVGVLLLLLALLRALQTETGSTFTGHLSWLPYLITAAAALVVLGLSVWRITKTPPARTPAPRGAKEGD